MSRAGQMADSQEMIRGEEPACFNGDLCELLSDYLVGMLLFFELTLAV